MKAAFNLIRGVKRASADNNAGVIIQRQRRRKALFESDLVQLRRSDTGSSGEGEVLRVRRRVLPPLVDRSKNGFVESARVTAGSGIVKRLLPRVEDL